MAETYISLTDTTCINSITSYFKDNLLDKPIRDNPELEYKRLGFFDGLEGKPLNINYCFESMRINKWNASYWEGFRITVLYANAFVQRGGKPEEITKLFPECKRETIPYYVTKNEVNAAYDRIFHTFCYDSTREDRDATIKNIVTHFQNIKAGLYSKSVNECIANIRSLIGPLKSYSTMYQCFLLSEQELVKRRVADYKRLNKIECGCCNPTECACVIGCKELEDFEFGCIEDVGDEQYDRKNIEQKIIDYKRENKERLGKVKCEENCKKNNNWTCSCVEDCEELKQFENRYIEINPLISYLTNELEYTRKLINELEGYLNDLKIDC